MIVEYVRYFTENSSYCKNNTNISIEYGLYNFKGSINQRFHSKQSVRDVARYYLSYKDEFEKLREELSACGTRYPAMKLMDMCMWQVAFETDKK